MIASIKDGGHGVVVANLINEFDIGEYCVICILPTLLPNPLPVREFGH